MQYYKIYCDEGRPGQYAGTLKPSGSAWIIRFKAGFEYYFGSGFEGLFEECCAYLYQMMRGHLVKITSDPTEEQIRNETVQKTIKNALFSAQKS